VSVVKKQRMGIEKWKGRGCDFKSSPAILVGTERTAPGPHGCQYLVVMQFYRMVPLGKG
jgi:hypothetical protein